MAIALGGCGGERSERPAGRAEAESSRPTVSTAGWRTDFSRHTVPLGEFQSGGPGKDGIPAIDDPSFTPVPQTSFLVQREPVIELVVGGEARAYPLQILVWHEIVNDEVAGTPVVVTFCPLCNTALAFDRRIGGRTLTFAVTGNLRHSDLVMYDRESESWWQQFGGRGVVGRYAGARLRGLPARIVPWGDFRRAHPAGTVLERPRAHPTSRESELLRPYGENPYPGYDDIESSPLFPAGDGDDRLPPKERVVFVERGPESVAIPFSTLARRGTVSVTVGGHRLVARYRSGVASPLDAARIAAGRDIGAADVRERGRLVPFDQPFWFAVAAFRPDVRIVR